jgi:peptide-methionine (S)-S-oxide reductase
MAPANTELATFGAGCFWQVEHEFRQVPGVVDAKVGYEGGDVENPTYEMVCSDRTGHAEVCQVEFDPEQVSYDELLEVFWRIHDPTQVDRQGPDVGSQYRSVIFTHSPEQEEAAKASLAREQARLRAPVATRIEPAKGFWQAEEYHQCYLERRRGGVLGTLPAP